LGHFLLQNTKEISLGTATSLIHRMIRCFQNEKLKINPKVIAAARAIRLRLLH
jgi:hypothetical protein